MFKMVFVVNMDLAMGVGKVAAQVGHAAVGLYQALQEKNSWREMAWKWDHGGAKKVVLQGTNMAHLLELQALAMSLSLPTYLVQDAGRTQVRRAATRQRFQDLVTDPMRHYYGSMVALLHLLTGTQPHHDCFVVIVAPAYRHMHQHWGSTAAPAVLRGSHLVST
ncbi:peptidyl-tRNA hydrolase 2, mitochondrial-like [Salvelinus sp. IW2-2015]|uniref:peptidyl-tRNA hydrolase 2, mitochondrial-like n=1 Tax=Salvelinus sp. IW2-2015 TaxID=2691554 RepID=UPI000CEABEE6|nr:probable peptidyl-tRNA hydrolase 2 [Salvelinus alpinus]